MTSYNRDTQVNTIIHFFVVPFIITVISSIGICIIHCNCSCKKERPKYRRPRIENIRHVSSLPLSFLLISNGFEFLKAKKTRHELLLIFVINFCEKKSIFVRSWILLLAFPIILMFKWYIDLKTNRYKHGFQSYRPSIVAQRALLSKKGSIASRAKTI